MTVVLWFGLWLALWAVLAVVIAKSTPSNTIRIGGGFIASFFGLFLIVFIFVPSVDEQAKNAGYKSVEHYTQGTEKGFSSGEKYYSFLAKKEAEANIKKHTTSLRSPKTVMVTAKEYGSRWSYTVSQLELECINNAVIGHTSLRTFNINGKAMGRYKDKYSDSYEISKQYPGVDDPQAKMPPPKGLISKGLELCN